MKKPTKKARKKAKKKRTRVPNQKFGRTKTMPFEEVVGRLLETRPTTKTKAARRRP